MIKLVLFLIAFVSMTAAQAQIVENPSFEEWEKENGKEEPVNWSSIQTGIPQNIASMAPQVMKKSEDAHTGLYSIKLENLGAFGIVATGTITSGRLYEDLNRDKAYAFTDPTDSRWNMPISSRPDSIVGWYKFQPPAEGEDFATVKVLLHTDTAKLPSPNQTNFVGMNVEQNLPSTAQLTWKRFSFPIEYLNDKTPEYALFVITSGNGVDAVKGSIAWFDDIDLVFRATAVDDSDLPSLINVRGRNNNITASLTRFGMGDRFNLKVFNLIGEQVAEKNINTGEYVEIDNLNRGVYFCVFTCNGVRTVVKKVLVQ